MAISSEGNTYLQSSGLNKALMTANPKRCAQVVSRALNLIYVLSVLVYPYMPAVASSLLKQINAPPRLVPTVLSNDLLAGHTIGQPDHLFKKIDEKLVDVWREKFGGAEGSTAEAPAQDPLKAAPGDGKINKKKAALEAKKAAKESKYDGPMTPEMEVLDKKIKEQGVLVRTLKGETPKSPELDARVQEAVEILKKLKNELAVLQT